MLTLRALSLSIPLTTNCWVKSGVQLRVGDSKVHHRMMAAKIQTALATGTFTYELGRDEDGESATVMVGDAPPPSEHGRGRAPLTGRPSQLEGGTTSHGNKEEFTRCVCRSSKSLSRLINCSQHELYAEMSLETPVLDTVWKKVGASSLI